ncbi:ATP-dependent DNA helicase RecQ [Amycolatopsis xylanica]|uniref:DNA 3'-5' helicase n=1 Tax=Amycolatopsis xylanica TaxID=589385 RepID=A0A1H2SI91_9PSEU|nr:DEAD/DEAH box helicase [Amycolatopsis xylanica]SDW30874.1 ATP-dependent DNA helicase RecQ [Amycolatopsis xylanica]
MHQITKIVAAAGVALTRAQLMDLARKRFRGQHPKRLEAAITEAVQAGALLFSGDRFTVPEAKETISDAKAGVPDDGAPVRAVIVDVESVVRTTATEPYLEKRIFQIGAIRLGTDSEWVRAESDFDAFVELPAGDAWQIRHDRLRAQHERRAVPVQEALLALQSFCAEADMLVTYNGTVADFPLLEETFHREGLPVLAPVPVDAYYLALALWPTAENHQLGPLADRVGVDRADLSWHNAIDDCRLLERLLARGAQLITGWDRKVLDLVASACPDSPAWLLLRHLADGGRPIGEITPHGQGDVANIISAQLANHAPRRVDERVGIRPTLHIDTGLRGEDQRIDPIALAEVAHGVDTKRRPAQEQMTTALHRWVDEGVPALVEAPTGTGKSFAVLAAALDWLSGAPDRTAVVTTFTKQLQQQLADDVAKLDSVVPGLLETSDLVKGQVNRLSLRGLTVLLADASTERGKGQSRPGQRNRFLDRPVFRELLVYFLLRLFASDDVRSGWLARSVDSVDVPAFFGEYAGPALPIWLESLSQASNGEYPAGAEVGAAAHTDVVREALTSHRLILANHALLLAHLDDLDALGAKTMLVVDEAHQLEDAATGALTATVDYRSVEDLLVELQTWVDTARRGHARESVSEATGNLEAFLDHEQLPRVAGMAFDACGAADGALVGARMVTLASAYMGMGGIPQSRQLAVLLTRLGGLCQAVVGALGAYERAHEQVLDFFERERVQTLLARCKHVHESSASVVDDLNSIVGQRGGSDVPASSAAEVAEDELPLDGEAELTEEGDEDDEDPVLGELPPGTSNRVVYAEEVGALKEGLRRYRFRIASSPVELSADEHWQQFLTAFDRTYYVSATLRVAGKWDFIRGRLGLSPGIATLSLATPFNLGKQSTLVCFSDFPSWAEQSEGAMRTVAHQLAGYAREMVRPAEGIENQVSRGGFDGGALVLTTARSTAGGISDHLATDLRRRGDETPVLSTLVLGNHRGYREFNDREYGGGFLVGTKGLWQGVDIDVPDRLRLVWINKLPFAPFAAPVIAARREAVKARAEAARAEDPDAVATLNYYLPLAALQLRQAVGRLIRSERHRGVVVISDRKLAGRSALRRAYRDIFLGSLDDDPEPGSPGLLKPDPVTGERAGGNVVTMAEGWAHIWQFFAAEGLLETGHAEQLRTSEALHEHTLLPQTRRIRELEMTAEEVTRHRAAGSLELEVLERSAVVGGLLRLSDEPADLKPAQREVIGAVAAGRDVLGLLPTGFGKSFCFQLPALVLPGMTIVVSPLVALMQDQALELNRSIGGAVRALVAPMRESSSRAGKTEVAEQLSGVADHGIRMVYVSPERLCQRRFRDLVRRAVGRGRVTRVVLDEAHTFVQWDDFRPAMSRVEQLLADLRRDFGLPVTALTATANRTVHAGLRSGVFGLSEEVDGEDVEAAEAATGGLVTVRENPIRPELAIFRRSMGRVGPAIAAGLAEEVVDKLKDHAIFYCLTVKEVVALHAHLRNYLGDGGARVRRFHGRLTEVEKSAVMTEFREAPRKNEEGFVPLVIVATSAFGLGINRADVRTVFCVSTPTDLAALYQQIGRAGRDAGSTSTDPNLGLTLLTTQGLRTVAFMTANDLRKELLERMGQEVLATRGVLDAGQIADNLIGADVAAGELSLDEARRSRTAENYEAGVVRVFAALAGLGAVVDLGDFPPFCAVKAGELHELAGGSLDDVEAALVAAVLALPARGQGLHRVKLDVHGLDRHLERTVPGYRVLVDDVAGTWQLLADLHDRGVLDVSAAPSRRLVTGLRVVDSVLPRGFLAAVLGKAQRAAEEIRLLRNFHEDLPTCANRKFADYFGIKDLPDGCCSHAGNRCSACWNAGNWPLEDRQSPVVQAFLTERPRAAGQRVDAAVRRQRLDEQVSRLVWDVFRGVHPRDLYRALRGEDSYFHPLAGRRVRLRTGLRMSRFFGANPSVRLFDIEDSLARLAADSKVVQTGALWRDTGHVRRAQARLAVTGASPNSEVTI